MARSSPISSFLEQAGAQFLVYGPPDQHDPVKLVSTFGELEVEYAAIRKHCVLIDQPNRAVLELTGADRLEFLNRMLTQQVQGLRAGQVARSFWLNVKGRIDADLKVIELGSRTLLELDVLAASRTSDTLSGFIITEDATMADRTAEYHRLALHGPTALPLLLGIAGEAANSLEHDGAAAELLIQGASVVAYRADSAGETGVELIVPTADALRVYQALLDAGHGPAEAPAPAGSLASRVRLRPIGWHAWNIARVEAGTPVYFVDFGPESLPAETGVLDDRVSFKKGCYLGQEIVARMHARGHPKQLLVKIHFESRAGEGELPAQPLTGSPITLPGAESPVGAVSSSVLSPMLSSTPIALASVRFAHAKPGTVVIAPAEGQPLRGTIQPSLVSFQRSAPPA